MNKWDRRESAPGAISKLREETDHWLPQVKGVPVVAVSGLTGFGLDRLMQAVLDAHAVWNRRVPTAALNRWLGEVISAHPPPAVSGRRSFQPVVSLPLNRGVKPASSAAGAALMPAASRARASSFFMAVMVRDEVPSGFYFCWVFGSQVSRPSAHLMPPRMCC